MVVSWCCYVLTVCVASSFDGRVSSCYMMFVISNTTTTPARASASLERPLLVALILTDLDESIG